jgi:3-hydroxyisobutyrate dehydrogenase-like beta-hydroxyacid dehydrogenase
MVSNQRVAILGMGRMGAAMAANLAGAGFELILYNRTLATAQSVATPLGATVAESPREAAAGAGVIISILADDEAVRAVYGGTDGLAAGVEPGAVVVEMSTIDPSVISEVGALIDEAGADLIDAPVSGSVPAVQAGGLTIMAAGKAASIETARPVLAALASNIFTVGGRGAGATTKLAVNALVHGLNGALAEALVLAERSGVDRSTAYDVFQSGAAGAPFLTYKRGAYEDPDGAPVAFNLDLVAKDLRLITGLAERVGAPMPQGRANLATAEAAVAAGLGERDMAALAVHLRTQS